jgi:exoribonuclease-2
MERYWCLRWLQQEQDKPGSGQGGSHPLLLQAGEGDKGSLRELIVDAIVLRENLVKIADIPLILRVPSLPELPADSRVRLAIGEIDLLDLDVRARYAGTAGAAAC